MLQKVQRACCVFDADVPSHGMDQQGGVAQNVKKLCTNIVQMTHTVTLFQWPQLMQ